MTLSIPIQVNGQDLPVNLSFKYVLENVIVNLLPLFTIGSKFWSKIHSYMTNIRGAHNYVVGFKRQDMAICNAGRRCV